MLDITEETLGEEVGTSLRDLDANVRDVVRVIKEKKWKGAKLIRLSAEMRAAGGNVEVCEINHRLSTILAKKGYTIVADDFTELFPRAPLYDRCCLNPPFEHGQDRIHVRLAFDCLKPGGRLVAIVSEGCFSRSLKADVAFRKWLDDLGADYEENPEDAFSGAGSERRTGVRTRTITIDKD